VLLRDVLLLRVAVAPNLVALDGLAGQVPQNPILVVGAGLADIGQQLRVTVFLAAPVIRTVERIELPSTREPITAARFSVESLFILTIMPDRLRIVKSS